MPDPRVPTTLARRHRDALERVAASFRCPEERLIDEAVEHYLKRLGVGAPGPLEPGEAERAAARRADAEWTCVLR
jgi:hypothetical protein